MQYKYLGNTLQSLAFRATNEDGIYQDYGVFNYPETYVMDENGEPTEVIDQDARPLFTTFFGLFVNDEGQFLPNVTGFDLACEAYLSHVTV